MTFDPEINEFTDWARRGPEYDPIKLRFYLIAGIPGSGKSTYAAHLAAKTGAIIVCPDDLRLEYTGNTSDQSRNHFIFSTLVPCRIVGAKVQGKSCILDATNMTRKNRKGLIALAREQDYVIEAHIMATPIEVCKARNAARERKVPVEVIDRMFRQWVIPTLGEGFDLVVEVSI